MESPTPRNFSVDDLPFLSLHKHFVRALSPPWGTVSNSTSAITSAAAAFSASFTLALHALHVWTSTLHILHYTPHSKLCSLYTPGYILHILHLTFHTLHLKHIPLPTPNFTFTLHFTLSHFAPYTSCVTAYVPHYTVNFTLYSSHFTSYLYIAHFTLYTWRPVFCTLRSPH